MKNTENNNPQPELLASAQHPKPLSQFVTAHQLSTLLPFAALDDAFLRNRARETNPRTGAPWIPKPINNQYELLATIVGLLEWFHARARDRDGLPAQYPSMQSMENALRLSKKSIRWLLKNGAGEAQHESNRIDPRPVLERADQIILAIAAGTIKGIDGLEEWNKDTELAKKLRLESEHLEDEKLLRRGEMLVSKDGTYAINELVADELIWEKRDQPLRAALIALPKTINRQHRTILNGAEPLPEKIRKAAGVVTDAVNGVLTKLRAKIPRRQAEQGEK